MNKFVKSVSAMAVAGFALAVQPASANYVIYEDTAYPSVLFFEFDDNDVSVDVISAPVGVPVITTPSSTTTAPAIGQDDAMAPQGDPALPADDLHGGDVSFNDANERARELSTMSRSDIERSLQQNAVDNAIIQEMQLRN